MKIIFLHGNATLFTIVDDEDYEELNQYHWCGKQGGNGGDPYVARTIRHGNTFETVRMHRVIMNTPKGMETDHINGFPWDNRKCNLKNVTKQENLSNRKY